MKPQSHQQSRSIVGDIIGPVKGLLTTAFNEFKGPVGDIVHFVTSTVLGNLIKFIANAVMDIFPGIPSLVTEASSIIGKLIQLMPAAVAGIKAIVDLAVTNIDGVIGTITDDVESVVDIIVSTINDLQGLGQTIFSRTVSLTSKTALLFENLTTTITTDTADPANEVLQTINKLATDVTIAIQTMPSLLEMALKTGVTDACQIFSNIATDILTAVNSLVTTCEDITSTIVSAMSSTLNTAVSVVKVAAKETSEEVIQLLNFTIAEIQAGQNEARGMVGAATRKAIATSTTTTALIEEGSVEISKGLKTSTSGIDSVLSAVEKVLKYLNNLSVVFASFVIIGLALIMFLTYRDMRKLRQRNLGLAHDTI
jgi:phage-related protein